MGMETSISSFSYVASLPFPFTLYRSNCQLLADILSPAIMFALEVGSKVTFDLTKGTRFPLVSFNQLSVLPAYFGVCVVPHIPPTGAASDTFQIEVKSV